MFNTTNKNEIIESLDVLDQDQAEKVLKFIKGILYAGKDEEDYQNFKARAMKEINEALKKHI